MGREESYLQQAWDLYYTVFKRVNAELPQVTMLELHNCSPALLHCRDLDLGVPGTYAVSGSAVRIRNFEPNVAIIRSKQRPRKIKIYGDDGREFVFLLKGHEDLRQDERAMQLFGLVNALLYYNRSTGSESHDLSIQRYAVVPLSPTAGNSISKMAPKWELRQLIILLIHENYSNFCHIFIFCSHLLVKLYIYQLMNQSIYLLSFIDLSIDLLFYFSIHVYLY